MSNAGRPKKVLTDKEWEQLLAMVRIQCTRDEILNIFGMTTKTLNRIIKERCAGDGEGAPVDFSTLHEKYSDEGKASLRRQQWKTAEKGNATMQIWLGKQYLNQKDKAEVGGDDERPLKLEVSWALPSSG